MIVLLDSTVLVGDPLLRSTAWKVLAHASSRGGVRVCISRVVFTEAVAGYRRRLAEARVGFERWDSKHGGALALDVLVEQVEDELTRRGLTYQAELEAALASIPVEILKLPDVNHQVLIQRAADRVPPCDQSGNGYRDTLNWFSVLELVGSGADELLWVTNDAGDFADTTGAQLHPVLQGELDEQDGGRRVELLRSLHETALRVAAVHEEEFEADLHKIQTRLAQDSLAAFVRSELLSDLASIEVYPRRLALPISIRGVSLAVLGDERRTGFEVRSRLERGEAAVEVSVDFDTTIVVEAPTGSVPGEDFTVLADDGVLLAETTKPLRFTAFISVDSYDRPIGGELTSVRALPEDPGYKRWPATAAGSLARWTENFQPSSETLAAIQRMQASIQPSSETLAAIQRMQASIQPSSKTLAAIQRMQASIQPSSETLAAIQRMQASIQPSSETLAAIQRMQQSRRQFRDRRGTGNAGKPSEAPSEGDPDTDDNSDNPLQP